MFCKNCGREVTEGKFCNFCGAPVEEQAPVAPAQPVAQARPVVTPNPQFVPTPPVQIEDPGKSSGTVALILGIVALALGTICSCLFACLGGIIPLGCAIASIIVGSQAKQKSLAAGFKNSQAQVGVVLSIVAIVIIVIFIIINAILGGAFAMSYYA